MRLPLFATTLIAGLLHCYLNAADLLPGYVIAHSNDTIHGYIRYPGWKENPFWIYFKRNLSDQHFTEYTPLTIHGFRVYDRTYIGAIVDIEDSEYHPNSILKGSEYLIKRDTAFLLAVIEGPKSLYLFKDEEGKEHYYIREENAFTLLLYKRYLNESNVIVEANQYRRQLLSYLKECGRMHAGLEYSRPGLISVFNEYYACIGNNNYTVVPREKVTVEYGVTGGAVSSKIDFGGQYIDYLNIVDYPGSVTPSGGFFLDLIFPGYKKRWSFYNAVTFTYMKTEGQLIENFNPDWNVTTDVNLGFSYVKFLNLLQYRPAIGKGRLNLGFGLTNGALISQTNERTETTMFHGTLRTITAPALEDVNRHEQGYVFKAGVEVNAFSVALFYEKSNGMSDYHTLSSIIDRYHVLVGYAF